MATPTLGRAVSALVLAGADVSVVNQTTLSLWHFQQLLRQLVPVETPASEPDEPEESKGAEDKENQQDTGRARVVDSRPSVGIELGEGMNVAAIQCEPTDAINGHNGGDKSLPVAPITVGQAVMTPETQVSAVYKRYRCVVCLDTSPSTLSIDPATGRVFLDLLYESVEVCHGSYGVMGRQQRRT